MAMIKSVLPANGANPQECSLRPNSAIGVFRSRAELANLNPDASEFGITKIA